MQPAPSIATPLVSVIIPTFQRPERLRAALASVGRQTHPRVEAIVVNNGGASVAQVVADHLRAYAHPVTLLEWETPRSISAARNAAAHAAQGEVLALLDDDDRYMPHHIQGLVAALEQSPGAVLAYAAALIEIEASASQAALPPEVEATCHFGIPYDAVSFLTDDYILTSAVAVRRHAWEAIGGFDETFALSEDWDFLLRLRPQGGFAFVQASGVYYSIRPHALDHASDTRGRLRAECLQRLRERHQLPPLVAKTFFDVARDFGCTIVPVTAQA